MIKKPDKIAKDEFKSQKWDEITSQREFNESDKAVIEMLCDWYAIFDRCITEITQDDGVRVVYKNSPKTFSALPQIAIMKTASDEIRQINKALEIEDVGDRGESVTNNTLLNQIQKEFENGGKKPKKKNRRSKTKL